MKTLKSAVRNGLCSALVAATAIAATTATAQEYPSKNVEIVVPFPAGSGVDTLARTIAEGFTDHFKQPFMVVNKPGATGITGTTYATSAKPDGHVLLFTAAALFSVVPTMQKSAEFGPDSVENVCQAFQNEMAIVVKPDSEITDVQDLIRRAKEQPGKLSYGHLGVGGIPHLAMSELADVATAEFKAVPMKGDTEVLPAVLGGHVDFGVVTLVTAAGSSARIVGIFGEERNPSTPSTPTVKEQGFDVAPASFGGIYAPAGLPEPIKAKLAAACKDVALGETYRALAKRLYQPEIYYADSAEFSRKMAKDVEEKGLLVKKLGLAK